MKRTLESPVPFKDIFRPEKAKTMISIGGVYRGPELRGSEINRTIMAITRVLNDLRGPLTLGELPVVNAVFVVPGTLGDAGFSGLQFGQSSQKDKV